jgi:hypothetical protein
MEMEQMMERLLAKMDASEAKMDANHAEVLARMEAQTDATLKEIIVDIRACQKAMEACLESKEPTSLEMSP